MRTDHIIQGDAAETLQEMPDSSVHMAMCSPPYFGLRDYGEDGQIGLEDSLEEYIAELVKVGEELQRVLREDGSWWLNLGDSYATAREDHTGGEQVGGAPSEDYATRSEGKMGRKNKMLVPHRTAIALQESGWVVRNDVTWVKPNPMPSSVKDRLNTTTEQVFHLVPNEQYWYDLDAIREPHKSLKPSGSITRNGKPAQKPTEYPAKPHPAGKNPGDVFEVTTKPFPDAHFAVYPPELCEKPIKATAPPMVCAECGTGYERKATETEKIEVGHGGKAKEGNRDKSRGDHGKGEFYSEIKTEWKWIQPCDCDTDATEPGIVLDPFAGAGTTLLVAKRLGRRFIGIDLNEEYVAMAQKRCGLTVDSPEHLRDTECQRGLESYTGTDPL